MRRPIAMTMWLLIAVVAVRVDGQIAEPDLDSTVRRAMSEFHVPGIAVGIIHDGRVIVSKGYGVRKLGGDSPVTDQTLFEIASNTKAFTSAALAILIDEKKLGWDDRVVDVLPSFQMSDAYVTREMRVRDLLCHRSGLALGAGDLLFFPDAQLSTSEFMRHLRYVPLATSFRSRYAYDNVLYTVAGEVIEKVSGQSWDTFIRDRIFAPLGMKGSRTRSEDVQPEDDVASPHSPADGRDPNGKLQAFPASKLGASAPAGAINASVADLLKWVNVQLHSGEYPGGRLFSAKQSREMWTPHIFMPIPADYPKPLLALKPHFLAYALGFVLYDYRGELVVYHTGGLNGMVTRVTMVPEKKLGVVVLTNQQQGGAFNAVTQTILDSYMGAPPTDWVTAFNEVKKQREAEATKTIETAAAHRNAQSKPSLPLEKYVGRYRDAWYGDVSITKAGDQLTMSFSHSPKLTGVLEHFQYDTFIVRWKDRWLDADAYVTFALNADGSIRDIKMSAVSPSTDFSFDFHDLDLKPIGAEVKPF